MRLGKIIKIYCQLNNITIRDLAKQIDASPTTVVRMLNGQTTASVETFMKLVMWLMEKEK